MPKKNKKKKIVEKKKSKSYPKSKVKDNNNLIEYLLNEKEQEEEQKSNFENTFDEEEDLLLNKEIQLINEEDIVINNDISSEESKEEDNTEESQDKKDINNRRIILYKSLKKEDINRTNYQEIKQFKKKDKKMKYEIPLYIDIKKTKNRDSQTNIIKEIYLTKINKVEDENFTYFKNLIFQEKKFYLITKKDDISKYNNLYYYCSNHRTTKTSEKLDLEGHKERINICDSKIKYEKDTNRYIFCEDHSERCNEIDKAKITNIIQVEKEINNYQNFTEALKDILNKNPVISFNDFKKNAQNLYYERNLDFKIKNSLYSNLYYNWRKHSNVHSKFSIFDNQITLRGNQFLRDYNVTMAYNKSNKSLFQHEHAIFISDYFIRKLNTSKHFYIDETCVFPKGFRQLIVLLYLDENVNKRFSGLFTLINNKKEEGYIILLKKHIIF